MFSPHPAIAKHETPIKNQSKRKYVWRRVHHSPECRLSITGQDTTDSPDSSGDTPEANVARGVVSEVGTNLVISVTDGTSRGFSASPEARILQYALIPCMN